MTAVENGGAGGIRYLTLGSTSGGVALAQGTGASATTAGQPAPVPYNSRVVNIFNGQLYGSASTAVGASGSNQISFRGVFNVGTGLPTTANQLGSLIVGSGTSNAGLQDSAYDYYYFANASTLYVGDDDTTAPATGGITKWLLSGTTWTKTWLALPAGATGVRALAGVTDTGSGAVELYGITAVSSGQTALVKLSDTLSGTVAPSFTTLVTAPANYLFRGVAIPGCRFVSGSRARALGRRARRGGLRRHRIDRQASAGEVRRCPLSVTTSTRSHQSAHRTLSTCSGWTDRGSPSPTGDLSQQRRSAGWTITETTWPHG